MTFTHMGIEYKIVPAPSKTRIWRRFPGQPWEIAITI